MVAGDRDAGQGLLQRLRPFVYRRYLDFGVFESLREMKQKITAEVRRKRLHDNIKLGGGGIREIEFFAQMFQLIRGGVLPALQQPAIQTTLATLGKEGFVPQPVCRELTEAYRFFEKPNTGFRRPTTGRPMHCHRTPLARLQLARSMGFDTWDTFRPVLDSHRDRVRSHFEGLLAPETNTEPTGAAIKRDRTWPMPGPFPCRWTNAGSSSGQQGLKTAMTPPAFWKALNPNRAPGP